MERFRVLTHPAAKHHSLMHHLLDRPLLGIVLCVGITLCGGIALCGGIVLCGWVVHCVGCGLRPLSRTMTDSYPAGCTCRHGRRRTAKNQNSALPCPCGSQYALACALPTIIGDTRPFLRPPFALMATLPSSAVVRPR